MAGAGLACNQKGNDDEKQNSVLLMIEKV
jgi:hypothetical protein